MSFFSLEYSVEYLKLPLVSVVSALNALFLSNALPLRESFEPVFSIELESDFFSVFSAFLPTVGCPLVVSTSGVSFFSTGLFFNLVLAVVTNLL
jgi:hypothetical protein